MFVGAGVFAVPMGRVTERDRTGRGPCGPARPSAPPARSPSPGWCPAGGSCAGAVPVGLCRRAGRHRGRPGLRRRRARRPATASPSAPRRPASRRPRWPPACPSRCWPSSSGGGLGLRRRRAAGAARLVLVPRDVDRAARRGEGDAVATSGVGRCCCSPPAWRWGAARRRRPPRCWCRRSRTVDGGSPTPGCCSRSPARRASRSGSVPGAVATVDHAARGRWWASCSSSAPAGAVLLAATSAGPAGVIGAVAVIGGGWGWTGIAYQTAVRVGRDRPAAAARVVLTGLSVGGAAGPAAFGAIASAVSYAAAWATSAVALVAGAAAILASRHGSSPRPRRRRSVAR